MEGNSNFGGISFTLQLSTTTQRDEELKPHRAKKAPPTRREPSSRERQTGYGDNWNKLKGKNELLHYGCMVTELMS